MLNQTESVLKIVSVLKENKLPISSVEKELGFSNGVIGKAAKGIAELSDEKMKKLQAYFDVLNQKYIVAEAKVAEVVVEESKPKPAPQPAEAKRTPTKMDKVQEMITSLNKKYGAGTVMKFGDKTQEDYDVVSTGSKRLDEAIGIGGLPLGRMVEMYGWESSGKSTIALHIIANAQQRKLKCLYIDAENCFDPAYADALGVEVSELIHCQPSCGEEALEIVEKMISAKAVQVVVIDSVAALVPQAELQGEMGESKMGLHARLMSQACRKLVNITEDTHTLLIWINQLRHKIGIVMGNPEVTPGGNALKFYASIRMEVKRSVAEKNMVIGKDGEKEGNLVTVKVTKNKCAPPYKTAEFDIIYGKGIVEN